MKYLQTFKDRHGQVRCYFRRRGYRGIKLPEPGAPSFQAAYEKALERTSKALAKPITIGLQLGDATIDRTSGNP